MSNGSRVKQARNPPPREGSATGESMDSFRVTNLHPGDIPCYREPCRHAAWRWGVKKGRRKASRLVSREVEKDALLVPPGASEQESP